jgi:circadian clock protein KaiB
MNRRAQARDAAPAAESEYDLRLYVAGATPKSVAAFRNLELLCEEHLSGRYRIEVIDLMKKPQLARDHQILAVPTLVRNAPKPVCKVVGTLSNTERVMASLNFAAPSGSPFAARKRGHHVP